MNFLKNSSALSDFACLKILIIMLMTFLLFMAACTSQDDDDQSGNNIDDDSGDDDSGDDDSGDNGPPPSYKIISGTCELLWWANGKAAGATLGRLVAGISDVDSDGIPDVLAVSSDPPTQNTIIQLRKGNNGNLIKEISTSVTVWTLAVVEDLDGDGIPEIAVGGAIYSSGTLKDDDDVVSDDDAEYHVQVLSTGSADIIWDRKAPDNEIEFGSSVAAGVDYNEDGKPDLIVGSPFPSATELIPGYVHILNILNGETLIRLNPPANAAESFGAPVAQASDINDDGKYDVFAGDPRGPSNYYGAGTVSALAVPDSTVLWTVQGDVVGDEPDILGDQIATAGDINGDGVVDLLVSAHNHPTQDCGEGTGKVLLLNGKDGSQLWSVEGRRCNENLGIGLASAGDVNGDLAPDVVAGAPSPPFPWIVLGLGGRFTILNGVDGSVIFDVESIVGENDQSDFFGSSVASIEDVTGDGKSEVIVGAPNTKPNGLQNAGTISVWTCPD